MSRGIDFSQANKSLEHHLSRIPVAKKYDSEALALESRRVQKFFGDFCKSFLSAAITGFGAFNLRGVGGTDLQLRMLRKLIDQYRFSDEPETTDRTQKVNLQQQGNPTNDTFIIGFTFLSKDVSIPDLEGDILKRAREVLRNALFEEQVENLLGPNFVKVSVGPDGQIHNNLPVRKKESDSGDSESEQSSKMPEYHVENSGDPRVDCQVYWDLQQKIPRKISVTGSVPNQDTSPNEEKKRHARTMDFLFFPQDLEDVSAIIPDIPGYEKKILPCTEKDHRYTRKNDLGEFETKVIQGTHSGYEVVYTPKDSVSSPLSASQSKSEMTVFFWNIGTLNMGGTETTVLFRNHAYNS